MAWLVCTLLLIGQLSPPPSAPGLQQPNILILVLDDLGVDNLGVYGLGKDVPLTPNIDQLAGQSVLFTQVWSNPICSPTRATIMSGRYSFRTGVEYIVVDGGPALGLEEITLAELVKAGSPGYAAAAFGKWHMGNASVGGNLAPNLAGFDHYAGALRNLHPPEDYFSWRKVVDGVQLQGTGYITSDTVDDAVSWITGTEGPWLAYVGFHAVHSPHHAPPPALHSVDLSGAPPPSVDARPYFEAMLEALDTEIGRLLLEAGIDLSTTYVIVVGDNGTVKDAIVPPFPPDKGKGTAYQGGVHVPLLIAGPGVTAPGERCDALVNTSDIHATVAEMVGLSVAGTVLGAPAVAGSGTIVGGAPGRRDSVSLMPYLETPDRESIRSFVLAEFAQDPFAPQPETHRAIRDERYKLLMRQVPPGPLEVEFYDLVADPFEEQDLLLGGLILEQQLALDGLATELQALSP